MARSLKKGPFADQSLLKKVDAMNRSEEPRLNSSHRCTSRMPSSA